MRHRVQSHFNWSLHSKTQTEEESENQGRTALFWVVIHCESAVPKGVSSEKNFNYGRMGGEVEHHFVGRFPGFARSSFWWEQYDNRKMTINEGEEDVTAVA